MCNSRYYAVCRNIMATPSLDLSSHFIRDAALYILVGPTGNMPGFYYIYWNHFCQKLLECSFTPRVSPKGPCIRNLTSASGTVEGSGTFWNCSLDDGLSYCGCVSERVIELDPISLSLIVMAMASSSTYSHT